MRKMGQVLLPLALLASMAVSAPAAAQPSPETPRCLGEPATIIGTEGADVIEGTSSSDVIVSFGGNDTIDAGGGRGYDIVCGGSGDDVIRAGGALVGGAGDDRLTGRSGPDNFVGGPGDDTFDGGHGRSCLDEVVYASAPGPIKADLQAGVATGEGRDTLIRIDKVHGTPFDDVLLGHGGWNAFVGGGGADVIDGRGGEIDDIRYTLAKRPVQVDLRDGSAKGEGKDRLRGLEFVYGSTFNDVLRGSRRGEVLVGYKGSDVLVGRRGGDALIASAGRKDVGLAYGGRGDDYLYGGLGESQLFGGEGDDRFLGDLGPDHMAGGPGVDRIIFEPYDFGYPEDDVADLAQEALFPTKGEGSVYVDLGAGTASGRGHDTLDSIEEAVGTDWRDVLLGSADDDRLQGGPSTDRIEGIGGDDTALGGGSADRIDGGDGHDRLHGVDSVDVCINGMAKSQPNARDRDARERYVRSAERAGVVRLVTGTLLAGFLGMVIPLVGWAEGMSPG